VYVTIVVLFNDGDDCTYEDLEAYCLDENNNLCMQSKIGRDGGRSSYCINASAWRCYDVHTGEE